MGPDPPAGRQVLTTNAPQPPPKLERLKKRWQFLAVAKGRSLARGAVLIQVMPRGGEADPSVIGLGFTATKRIGGAVVRNRAKRRLREAARMLAPLHGQPGHDYVMIARASITTRAWARLLDDVKSALISLAAPPSPETGDDPSHPARSSRPSAPPRPA